MRFLVIDKKDTFIELYMKIIYNFLFNKNCVFFFKCSSTKVISCVRRVNMVINIYQILGQAIVRHY